VESAELVTSVASAAELEIPSYERACKRAFDLAVATFSLLCVAPVVAVAMFLIVLESSGSPIFTQLRIGQRGRVFRILKLRTMFKGSDKLNYKTVAADERLTKVGSVLRSLNIDELPQLINIINGDMSVVGPRPLSLDETQFLTEQAGISKDTSGLIPVFRPGLVGLEQVNRDRTLTYAERFRYNDTYESNWSLALDSKILLKAMYLCRPICAVVAFGALALVAIVLLH
jgi:lipopolysaccharide/colanic/teichoic acid biosynthesis glycosyltransferase